MQKPPESPLTFKLNFFLKNKASHGQSYLMTSNAELKAGFCKHGGWEETNPITGKLIIWDLKF